MTKLSKRTEISLIEKQKGIELRNTHFETKNENFAVAVREQMFSVISTTCCLLHDLQGVYILSALIKFRTS